MSILDEYGTFNPLYTEYTLRLPYYILEESNFNFRYVRF